MKEIRIDASAWLTSRDLYAALFKALGSPEWHGSSVDAFIDSMIYGRINEVDAPYRLLVTGAQGIPEDVKSALLELANALSEFGAKTRTMADGTIKIDIR